MDNFSFVDLSMMEPNAKTFDGMAAGTFVDMWGRSVEFKPEELSIYVNNTKAALESTRDSGGNIVGFPINQMDHQPGAAAGWIVDVNLSDGRNVLEFTPRWNEAGKRSIGADEMRFFSPTVDIEKKVIVGGSLTNVPASRTPEHKIMLRPVELSSQISTFAIEETPVVTLANVMQQGFAELKSLLTGRKQPDEIQPENDGEPTMPEPVIVDLSAYLQSPEALQLINARAEEIATARLAAEQRKSRIAALSTSLTGGTADRPAGLPVAPDALTAFLSKLEGDLLDEAEALFSTIADKGLIDFTEHGHSRVVQGTQQLPDEVKIHLSAWIDQGLPIEEFFKVNAVELGAQSDYNLSEFVKE